TNFIAEITGRLQFDDSSVLSEVPYTYQVRAKNPGGTGPFTPATVGMRRQAQPGELLYEWNLGSSVQTSPAIGSDGLIYVTAGSKLFCLQTNGTIRWEYDAPVSTSPT